LHSDGNRIQTTGKKWQLCESVCGYKGFYIRFLVHSEENMNFFTHAMIARRGLRLLFGVGGITLIATLAALIVGASLSTETLA
jgi:hypothetical protein